jgi:hypothetical protein
MIFEKHVNAINARSTSRQNMLASHFPTRAKQFSKIIQHDFEGTGHTLPKSISSTHLLIDNASRVQCGVSKSNSRQWYQEFTRKRRT